MFLLRIFLFLSLLSQKSIGACSSSFSLLGCRLPAALFGNPAVVSSLPKAAWQRLIEAMADRFPAWKGHLIHKSGRLALIKSTLAAVPVQTIGLELPAWVRKHVVKTMHCFLWTGKAENAWSRGIRFNDRYTWEV
jgi:hypothetical protein